MITSLLKKIVVKLKANLPIPLGVILFFGFLLRLLIVGHPGFLGDIVWWKWWALVSSKDGLIATIYQTAYNYPPAYLYILKSVGVIYRFFAPPNIESVYWRVNDYFFLFLIKMPSVIADLVSAWGIWYLLKNFRLQISKSQINNNPGEFQEEAGAELKDGSEFMPSASSHKPFAISYLLSAIRHLPFAIRHKLSAILHKLFANLPTIAALLYILNPVVIFDSAWWGQTDSVGTALTLVSLIFLVEGKSLLAAGLSTATIFIKTQFIVFTPFVFLVILLKEGYKKTVKSLAVGFVAFIIINLPFLLIRRLDSAISLITSTVDYFPNISMNAFNLWWIAANGKGAVFSDKHFLVNDVTYKTAGLLFFVVAFAAAVFYLIKKIFLTKGIKTRVNDINHTESEQNITNTNKGYYTLLSPISFVFAFIPLAFFMLNTQMHERYIFPVFAFTLIWIFSANHLPKAVRFVLFAMCYLFLSISAFLNLHVVLVWNYPQNGLPFLSSFRDIPFTMVLAWIQTLVFLVVTAFVLKEIGKRATVAIGVAALAFVAVLIFAVPQKQKVHLSDVKPVFWAQEWGKPTKDRSVGTGMPRTGNNFLSSAYYFYKRGIGAHANSTLTYPIMSNFKTFETDMGVDTEAGNSASVEFVILADDETLFQSGIMKKWDSIKHAKVDVSGKKYLTLKVTNGGDSNYGDHADWLNPMLER